MFYILLRSKTTYILVILVKKMSRDEASDQIDASHCIASLTYLST